MPGPTTYSAEGEQTTDFLVIVLIIRNLFLFSGAVGDAFEKATPRYLRKCNNRHNPIPEFLMLVKKIGGKDNTQIDSIIQACNARTDANNYFS